MATNITPPDDGRNVMVTFNKVFARGAYGSERSTEQVTKRGWYDKESERFIVPPAWARFKGVLLPDGWGGDRLKIVDIINWSECKD